MLTVYTPCKSVGGICSRLIYASMTTATAERLPFSSHILLDKAVTYEHRTSIEAGSLILTLLCAGRTIGVLLHSSKDILNHYNEHRDSLHQTKDTLTNNHMY